MAVPPTAADVAAFLGKGDAATLAITGQALPIITAMARSYTRDNGFTDVGPADDIAAVIVTATARLVSNPGQLEGQHEMGPFRADFRGGFTGWTLVETFVLNRYRVRAL